MMVSVHHYELAADATDEAFREAVSEAERRGCFDLPGLVGYRFLRGVKGNRQGRFAAEWVYESRAAWENLWGPVEDPHPKSAYPDEWVKWEDDLLAPLLAGDPDEIEFTSYEVVASGGAGMRDGPSGRPE